MVMGSDPTFLSLIARVRSGDEVAASELVRLYEPEIRREVRFLLRDPQLRRTLDSMDICQSVMGSFFARAALGEYDLDRPENLLRLLVTMTRNKIADASRRQRAQRRDSRRVSSLGAVDVAASSPSPSESVSGKELLNAFHERFTPEERQLADCRAKGQEWAEIADRLGGTPESRRKQLTRAIERISQQLGLDEAGV
jgi:RNA polymerase sigma-70 factor (ECF subfamily)